MTKFGNPNYVSASLRAAADHGNEEMMKVLLNMDDKGQPLGYRWRFNWVCCSVCYFLFTTSSMFIIINVCFCLIYTQIIIIILL